MGSGISGNYDEITPIFTLGYWKVHSALTKEKHEAVSLWLLDFDRIKADAKSRSERNKYIESCLYSIQTMKQLDHPNILKILVANENLSDLAFAAEPVAFSLENNLNYSNDEVYYICDQLSNLASYLSNEKNLVSFHFYPGSFAFTSKFILKLCLFNFTSVIIGQQGQTVPRQIWSKSKLGSPLNYTAPEYSNNQQTTKAADTFSFGALITSLFIGKDFFNFSDEKEMQKSLAVASVDIPESIPEDIRPLLQCCFEADPSRRLTFSEIQRFPIFMCLLIRNLRIIDSIENKPESERYDFYGTLKQNISLFSQRLLQKKILPLLTKEIFYDFRFGPVVFPLIYLIADRMNKFDFMEYIYKPLAGLFKKMDPPDFAVAVLNGLKIVIDHVEKSVLHDIVYPIIFDGLSSKAAQVQAAAAKHLPYFIFMSSESNITYHILPKINSAIVSVSNDPVVIGSLLSSYENCIDQMDNDIFVESVMPALSRLWKKLQSPELAKPFSIIVRKQHATLINNLRHVTPLVCEILTNENVEPSVQDIFLKYVEDQLGSIRKERNIPSNTLNKLNQQRHATSPTSKSQPQTPSFQSLKQQPQANPTQNHLNNQFNSQPNIFSNEQNTFNIQLNENSSQNQNKNQKQNQPNVFQNQQPDIFDNVIFHNQSNQFSSSPNVYQPNNGNLSTEKETNSFVPDYSENKNDDTDFFSLINVVPSQPQPQPFIQNQNQSPQISSNSSTSLFAGMNLM